MNCGRCNFTTCRYNFGHNCTDRQHRNECISVKHNKWLMRDKDNKAIMDKVVE